MQQTILKLDNNFNVSDSYKLDINPYTNSIFTGFVPLQNGFITCASPQSNASGYIYQVNSDATIKFSKKTSGSAERTFYRMEHVDNKLIAVGKDNTSGDDNFLVSTLGDDGSINTACSSDTALLDISNPTFTVSDFVWPTISSPSFSNTNFVLSNSAVSVTKTDLCFINNCVDTTGCDDWLNVKASLDGVRIGDLDVTGNKITVEALVNRIALPADTATHRQGDIVSKQRDFNDVNYLLRADRAEITTTKGYFKTIATCPFESNKTYHIAMVYDGESLKFYRNGFLLGETACSGNLITNDWITTIGEYAFIPGFWGSALIGYINEVRIWNVARTQDQLRTYMDTSLPNPTTQSGLLAYYTFDNLKNKQGNSAWDGTLMGNASINATNPTCDNFIPDSCDILPVTVTASFNIPDTVCVNTPVKISNTSKSGSSYYWNFCEADVNKTPEALNIGNPSNILSLPVFIDFAKTRIIFTHL